MKSYLKHLAKKTLAVFMAVLMIMTAWVFVAPEKAQVSAAGDGQYSGYVRITIQEANNITGHLIIHFRSRDSKTGLVTDSSTEQTLVNSWSKEGYGSAGGPYNIPFTCSGYPYKITCKADATGSGGQGAVRVWGIDINGTYTAFTADGYLVKKGNEIDFLDDGTNTAGPYNTWQAPYVNSGPSGDCGDLTITIPKPSDSKTAKTDEVEAEWTDQYGYEWPVVPKYTLSNSNLAALKVVGDTAHLEATNGNLVALTSANGYDSSKGQATTRLTAIPYEGNTTHSCYMDVIVKSPEFDIKFYNENGTDLIQGTSQYYGQSITAPSPTKASDDNNKYTFNKWLSLDGGNATVPSTVSDDFSAKASYTATPHTFNKYEQKDSNEHYYVCGVCGYKKTEACPEHTYSIITGDNDYHNKTCIKCGKVTKVSHDYANSTIDPTCTTDGYTTSTCRTCGHVWTHDQKPALGHDFTGKAVSNNDGTHSRECSNGCGETGLGTTAGGKENCSYGAITDSYNGQTHYRQCSVCNYQSHTNHEWREVIGADYYTGVEGTCITGKQYYKSCACGAVNTNEVFYDDDKVATNHHHYIENGTLEYSEAVPPTCLDDGRLEYWYCPDCGIYSKDDIGNDPSNWYANFEATLDPATGHTFNDEDYVSDGNATCTADGTETATCANGCGETHTRTEAGSKIPHSFTNYAPNNDADCENPGTETAYCDYGCNTSDKRENAELYPALGHEFLDENYTFDAGSAKCGVDGTETAKCTRCDKTNTRTAVGTALQHNFTVQKVEADYLKTAATCDDAAVYYYACANGCTEKGDATYSYGAPLGHNYDSGVVTTQPHCITNGERTFTCQNDPSHTYTEVIPALGHIDANGDNQCERCGEALCSHTGYGTYTDGYKAADCNNPGYSGDIRCNNCHEIITAGQVVPALGHAFTEMIQDEKHLKSKADCKSAAVYYYDCSRCDVMANDETPNGTYTVGTPDTLNGHTWQTYDPAVDFDKVSVLVEATCQTPALYSSYCPVCGKNAQAEHKDIPNATFYWGSPVEHKFTTYVSDNNATCQKDGTKTALCDFGCGKATHTIADVGSQKEHDFSNPSKNQVTSNANGTHLVACKTCNRADGEIATVTVDCSAAPATCTEASVCVCGYKLADALDHDFDETIKENINPVDAENPEKYPVAGFGEHVIKCSRCDEAIVVKCKNEATVVPPTCTDKGYTTYKCPVCDNGYSGSYVPATGHSWVSFEPGEDKTYLKSEATCMSPAIYYAKCENCDVHATEENAGEKNYTFTVGEALPHVFTDKYVNNGDDTHSILCDNDCGTKKEAEDCQYGEGVITLRPEEIDALGEITYTCEICKHEKVVKVERAYYIDYIEAKYLVGTLLSYSNDLSAEAIAALEAVLAQANIATNLIDCGHAYSSAIIDQYAASIKAILEAEKADEADEYDHEAALAALKAQLCGETNEEAGTKACAEQCEVIWATALLKAAYETYKTAFNEYKVQFVVNGEVVKEETVVSGGDATAPEETPVKDPSSEDHFTFRKWDKSFTNVKDNLVINALFDDEAHKGGEATCEEKAVCAICKAKYGELLEHSYTGAIEIDEANGTHKIQCVNGCEEYSEPEAHKGGEATCEAKAKCEVCDAEYGDLAAHVYDKEVAENRYLKSVATCQDQAVYYKSCVCGKSVQETYGEGVTEAETDTFSHGEYDVNNHTELEDVNGKAATCVEEGYKPYKFCKACDAKIGYEVIPFSGHNFTLSLEKDVNEESTLKSKATCTSDEVYYKICSVCKISAKNIDEEATWEKADTKLDHEFGKASYAGVNEAKKHIHVEKCINCLTLVTTECTEEKINETESTCKTGGYITYKCEVCLNTHRVKKSIDKTNHAGEIITVNAKVANCIEKGYTGDEVYGCCYDATKDLTAQAEGVVQKVGSEIDIDEDNHEGAVTIPQVDATCQSEGKTAYEYCEDCKKNITESETIAMAEHKFVTYVKDADADTHTATCSTCADGTEKATKTLACAGGKANCIEKAKCDTCGETYGKTDDKNHKTVKTYYKVDSTCQTAGHETYKHCIACDTDTTEKVEIPKKDHKYGTPTSNGDGTHSASCITCKGAESEIAKLNENCSGGTANCRTRAKCTKCYNYYGTIDTKVHAKTTTKLVNAVAATCTTEGYTGDKVYTCCYDSSKAIDAQPDAVFEKGSKIEVIDHTFDIEAYVYVATCKDTGRVLYMCKCGQRAAEEVILPINPNNHYSTATEIVGKKDATCTEDGYTGDVYYSCCYSDAEGADNSKALKSKGEVISSGNSEHDFSNAPVSDNMGRHDDGKWYHVYTCAKCSETKTEACATFTNTADCEVGDICARCGAECSLTEPTNHKTALVKVDGEPATCIKTGIKDYYKCESCDEYFFDSNGFNKITEENKDKLIIPVSDKHSLDRSSKPTANNDGTHTYTCSIEGCNAKLPAENCSGGEATCTAKAKCQHCGAEYGEKNAANHTGTGEIQEVIPANGCIPGFSGVVKWSCCGAIKDAGEEIPAVTGHTWKIETTKQDNCAASYTETKTCQYEGCGVVEVVEHKGFAHETTKVVYSTEATCTVDRTVYKACANCSYTDKSIEIDGVTYNYLEAETVEAKDKCSFGGWVEIQKPSCVKEGLLERVCTGCGNKETKSSGYADHVLVTDPGVEATCDVPGKAPYTYCVVEGCPYAKGGTPLYPDEAGQVIEAKGHGDYNGDGWCDGCGGTAEIQPDNSHCGCICHKQNGLMKIFYKILLFFWKLFGINQTCGVGAGHVHY